VTNNRAGDTVDGLRVVANGPSEPFSRPRHERQPIVASVCDRLVGNLDSSLRAAWDLCSAQKSGVSGGSGASDDRNASPERSARDDG
jgi:hypothetical protein